MKQIACIILLIMIFGCASKRETIRVLPNDEIFLKSGDYEIIIVED
jgi:hypothetical protein